MIKLLANRQSWKGIMFGIFLIKEMLDFPYCSREMNILPVLPRLQTEFPSIGHFR